ncbi:MAG: competence/damage-inducible protein A [Balneolaceae bacterium]
MAFGLNRNLNKTMIAHILSIGNELLIGDTVNTNASWIGQFLTAEGFRVQEIRTLNDEYKAIQEAISGSMERADLVVVTGGLGPTHDDITKAAAADLFGTGMVSDQGVLEHIEEMFRKRGLQMTESNREQASIPEGATVLFNRKGTAPGIWYRHNGSCLVMLPGVPYEMRYLMEKEVKPMLDKSFPGRPGRAVRYLKTAGVAESTLSDLVIGDLSKPLAHGGEVAWLPSPAGVTLRVTGKGESAEEAEENLERVVRYLQEKAGDLIYGEGRECTLSETVGALLRERGLEIAVAESCTGGLIGASLTDAPGSSDYFAGGVVAYENRIKEDLLGVPEEVLKEHGAVSCEVAIRMADAAADRFGCQIGISTTGIAGPGGGSGEKPVGLVWIGFHFPDARFALKGQFSGDRFVNRERSVSVALETVRRHLLQIDPLPYDLRPHYA